MGAIREVSTGRILLLEPEHLVGRAPSSALRLAERYVSAQHAIVRWTDAGWELKDLGSRNGTYLEGARVQPGKEYRLERGARIAFGKIEQEFELVDVTPPQVMAIPGDGGEPVLAEGDLLALPSNDDPRVTIYRSADGSWLLEQPDDSTTPVTNLQSFEVDGRVWKFCCTEQIPKTTLANPFLELEVRHIHLTFSVSRDEEHVELRATAGSAELELGARNHNYLLLTLARRRLADAAEALPETTCGWVYQEDLATDLGIGLPQLNLEVFRLRKQFASLGVADAANIVERRPRTRQLRVGTGRITIVEL
ncbi:MAG TPA: FHA domain-containing protein [Polyangiaceae bacterium]|nr:FHA domain-containing protein [Polyangiaceae bacterium]